MRLRMFWLTASACLSVAECSCLTQLGTSCWKRQKRSGTNKLKKTCLSKLKHTRRKKNKKMVPPKSKSQQTDARNSVQRLRQRCVRWPTCDLVAAHPLRPHFLRPQCPLPWGIISMFGRNTNNCNCYIVIGSFLISSPFMYRCPRSLSLPIASWIQPQRVLNSMRTSVDGAAAFPAAVDGNRF